MINTYYFNSQFARYIVQFMNIFNGLTVMTGKAANGTEQSLLVPIQYGSKDRVASSILNDNTQNKPLRLPVMSCFLSGITYADNRKKGVGTMRTTPYVPRGGLLPEDAKVVHQLMPNPYDITMSLSIFTSNINTQHQILEQIFMLFDPILQIQISDSAFDWTKLTTVFLRNINYEENYPAGTDRRMIVTTITFDIPIYISAPANLKNQLIQQIYARIGIVEGQNLSNEEIIDQLDKQNINYELIVSTDDLIVK
jgi:hypothetical protein